MITYRDFVISLEALNIPIHSPVIVHASVSAFGQIRGGAEAVVAALLDVFPNVIMPTFTYKTMLVPEAGPSDNGIVYGSGRDRNRMAEFFTPEMPADKLMGLVPETLRRSPLAHRSIHPILSFAGVGAKDALQSQTIADPLAPIRLFAQQEGWVLLLGVGHTVNTSIHAAEQMTGRQGFIRWALTRTGVQRCAGFPGCSNGFGVIDPIMGNKITRTRLGQGIIQTVSLNELFTTVKAVIQREPTALLCSSRDCSRCRTVRNRHRPHS